MNEKQLEKLNTLVELLQNDTVKQADIEKFLSMVVEIIKQSKDNFEEISKTNLAKIASTLEYIQANHADILDTVDTKTNNAIKQFEDKVKDFETKVNSLENTIKEYKPENGKDADEEKIVEDVLARIPKVEIVKETGESIVDKINALNLDEVNKIDAKHIKNLPTAKSQLNVGSRLLDELANVHTTGKTDGQTLIWDNANQYWKAGTASGGTITGSGIPNRLTYWNGTTAISDMVGYEYTGGNLEVTKIADTFAMKVVGTDTFDKFNFGIGSGNAGFAQWFKSDGTLGTVLEGESITSSSLAGTGTRMVVASAGGLLSTQAIPTGTVTGSGAAGQISFWTGASTQSGSSSFIWDNSNTRLGIGIAKPQSFFNASQAQYSTGTASQSGTTITGVGTTFTSSMIGSQFIFADGTSAGTITAFGSTTSLTVSVSQTVSPAQAFTINYQGLRGNNNNWAIGGAPSGGIGPFFKVGGPTTSNTFAITGSNLSPTIVAGFDSGTTTDGDGSLGSYSNTTNSATSGAVRFFRANPSGAVTTGWVLGEMASYGGKTATTFTDRSASIRFVATEAHSSSAAGTNITFSTVGNTTTTLTERMRLLQDGNLSIGTTSSLSRLAVLSTAADQARFLYDTSNYWATSTSSVGLTTLTATGTASTNPANGFTFTGSKTITASNLTHNPVITFGGSITDNSSGNNNVYRYLNATPTITVGSSGTYINGGTIFNFSPTYAGSGQTLDLLNTHSVFTISPTFNSTVRSNNVYGLTITRTSNITGTNQYIPLRTLGTGTFTVDDAGNIASTSNSIALASTTNQASQFTFANGFRLQPSTGVTGAASGAMGVLGGIAISPTSGTIAQWQLNLSGAGFAPTSGTATYTGFEINTTINQTGGANGIVRGFYFNPTLTSIVGTLRAFESTQGTFRIADTTVAGSGSLAGSLLDMTQTWNTSGAPTAIKLNVTNTASGAAALLMDLQVGGTSQFNVSKAGTITIVDAGNIGVGTTTGTKIGTSTSQKLGFWDTTPIVQPTTAVGSATVASPGAGSVIKTDDTFDGYTLAQVVKALRNAGLLA